MAKPDAKRCCAMRQVILRATGQNHAVAKPGDKIGKKGYSATGYSDNEKTGRPGGIRTPNQAVMSRRL
jgi:hypothetical protein